MAGPLGVGAPALEQASGVGILRSLVSLCKAPSLWEPGLLLWELEAHQDQLTLEVSTEASCGVQDKAWCRPGSQARREQ